VSDSAAILLGGAALLLVLAVGLFAFVRLAEWRQWREINARLWMVTPRLLEVAKRVERACDLLEKGRRASGTEDELVRGREWERRGGGRGPN